MLRLTLKKCSVCIVIFGGPQDYIVESGYLFKLCRLSWLILHKLKCSSLLGYGVKWVVHLQAFQLCPQKF